MKIIKIIGISLVILFLIGLGINYWANKRILKELNNQGQIICNDLSINVFTKYMTIKGFEINRALVSSTDTAITQSLQVHIETLTIKGCQYFNFLWHKELCLGQLTLENPLIKIVDTPKNKIPSTSIDTVQQPQKSSLKFLNIQKVYINHGQLIGLKNSEEWLKVDTLFTEVAEFSLDFESDSSSISWQGVVGDFRQITLDQPTAKNQVLAARLLLDSQDKKLLVHHLKWTPKQDKAAFMQDLKFRQARLDLEIPRLEMSQFSLETLLWEQVLSAQKIEVTDANLQVYNDKNVPACEDCYKPYFHEQFQNSPFKMAIDTILIKNSNLGFEELAEEKSQPGKLTFPQLYASIYNLNHANEQVTTLDLQSHFMEESTVKVHFDFWLNSPNQDYKFKGEVNHFSLEKINPFLAFTANARIQKGEVKELLFNGVGNHQTANGEMQFSYENLEVVLFDKEKEKKKLLSKIINKVLVAKENPDDHGFNEGKMYFERDRTKSFISNWWKTIQSGFQSTMFPDLLLKKELKKD